MHSDSKAALAFTRASHHDGPPHIVRLRECDLRPISCSCAAGAHGRLCWAVIDVAAVDLERIARDRWAHACGETEIRQAAAVLVRVRKWAAAARELQTLRSIDYRITACGRAAIGPVVA